MTSMSRAELFVPTCSMMSALLATQSSANSSARSTASWRSCGGVGGDVGLGEEAVVVVDAVDERLALAGAPGIPPDDVEMVEQLLVVGHELGEDRELAPAESGSAGVHEQGTDPLVGLGGAVAGEVQLERRALGIGVVDRDVERRDIDAVGEVLPFDGRRLELIGIPWCRGVPPSSGRTSNRSRWTALSSPCRCCSPAA